MHFAELLHIDFRLDTSRKRIRCKTISTNGIHTRGNERADKFLLNMAMFENPFNSENAPQITQQMPFTNYDGSPALNICAQVAAPQKSYVIKRNASEINESKKRV